MFANAELTELKERPLCFVLSVFVFRLFVCKDTKIK